MKLQKIAGIMGAVILGLALVTAISSPAFALVEGPFRLWPSGGNLCLDVQGAWVEDGTPLLIWECLPNHYNQQFNLYADPNNPTHYQIVAAHSGKCLDVEQASTSVGARIIQYTCLGFDHTNQVFAKLLSGSSPTGNWYYLIAQHSSLCLGYATTPYAGEAVTQQYCDFISWNLQPWN